MDPLSITSAAAGFVGTLQTIYTLASRITTADKDGKKAFEEFKGQIQYFERILSDLQSLIDEAADAPGNMSQDYSQLETYLKTCTSKLQEFVDKFKPPLYKWKGLLYRFTWPLKEEERRGLVDLVNQYKNSIQLELTVKQSRAIQATAAAVQAESCIKDILKWLSSVEVNSNFDRAREKCHPGTGQWFLQSSAFERFRGGVGECIWLHGIPGAGKTILSGSIIAAMRNHVESKPSTGLAYFFFAYTDKTKQNTFNMLSSIAAQLAERISNIPSRVVTLYNNNKSRPPISVVLEVITRLARCFHQTYIILDALDEITAEERPSLMKALNEIIANARLSNINLLMTSRREPYLVDGFHNILLEEISLTTSNVNEDIKLYVTEIVDKEPKLSKWSVELRAQIVQTLSDKAMGMFRWVECQVNTLRKCRRPYDVKKALVSLPQTLDETYRRILLAVEEENRVYLARLLTWVIFTQHPLCLDLLAEAIIFEPDSSELDPDQRFADPKDILDFCGNLFGDSSFCDFKWGSNHGHKDWWSREPHSHLTLSHYSVQEYLLSERVKSDAELSAYNSIINNGPSYIMDVYFKYFTFTMTTLQQCHRVVSADTKGCSDCHGHYPLLVHSLNSLREGPPYGVRSQDSITDQKQQQSEEQFANILCEHFAVFQHLKPFIWSPLAYLAKLGFVHGIKQCISHGWDVNDIHFSVKHYSTPLSSAMWAPLSRRLAVTTFLLELGATDIIDIVRPSGYVVQCSPALENVLRVCLMKIGHQDIDRGLHEDVIRLLLDHGSLINSPYYAGGTLLAPTIFEAFNRPYLDWVPQLLYEYGGCLDVVFPRYDGLVDSFSGEFMEYCVTVNPPEICQYALTHGAKIGRHLYEDNVVNTLLRDRNSREYFAWNMFCAMDPAYIYRHIRQWSKDRCKQMWVQRISFLQHLGYDINALDCIVGDGKSKQDETCLHLEYCTALDCVSAIGKFQENEDVSSLPEDDSTWYEYRLLVSSVLIQHGAKVLPR
ncbi:hypothetical protein M422DRAFT_239162 [Sphaerobolus stellatus SS14]|nr:hypothetical protein M422DRAFT_239162 [Sphaerobolus stellatus SS14]